MSGRVGPFEVVRELSDAPGACLVEARDADGERRLLQLARFRAAVDDGERGQRQAEERAIARRTAELIGDPDVVVHAHGGTDGISGERILFWALPYSDRPPLAGQRLSTDALIDLGAKLAARLVERHGAGKLDPLLSEHFVRLDADGEVEIVGVPLAIDRGWAAPDMPTFRAAPEENGSPTRSGDLFRLGRMLENLAPADLPEDVRRTLARLTAANGERFGSAHLALEAFDALSTPSRLSAASISTEITTPLEPPWSTSIPDVLDPAEPVSVPELAPTEVTSGPLVTADPGAVASEAVTHTAEPVTPIPSESPLVVEVQPRSTSAVISRQTVEMEAPETEVPPEDDAAFDALAASWRQPVLPAGESPWSEVVEARGAHHRLKEQFPGFPDSLPFIDTRPKKPSELPPVPPRPLPPLPVDNEIDEEIAAAITGFNAKKIVTAVLALLVIFGLFAAIARSGDPSRAPAGEDVLEAPPTNELVLESDPPGATVIAESDGAILGKTPLSFLVPRGNQASVFLALPDHEPIKMTLPERGAVRARLMSLDVSPCRVDLTALGGAKLEGVGFELGPSGSAIPGAGIVRAAEGPSHGAYLVTCPSLGGKESRVLEFAPPRAQATVRITAPAGAGAYLDGDPIGKVPTVAKAKRSFARIRVDSASGMSEERLVPTDRDLEVRMPTPKPRRLPVLVVPGESEEQSAEEAEIEEVRQLAPSPEAALHYKRALEALDGGDTRSAKSELQECLANDSNDALCHREIAELYRRLRSPQKAREHYLRYLEIIPSAPDAERIRAVLNE